MGFHSSEIFICKSYETDVLSGDAVRDAASLDAARMMGSRNAQGKRGRGVLVRRPQAARERVDAVDGEGEAGILGVELQTKVPEDFTITEKAPY